MKEVQIRKDRTPAVLRKLAKDETDARVARNPGDRQCDVGDEPG